jgi:hypothetical protein
VLQCTSPVDADIQLQCPTISKGRSAVEGRDPIIDFPYSVSAAGGKNIHGEICPIMDVGDVINFWEVSCRIGSCRFVAINIMIINECLIVKFVSENNLNRRFHRC